MADNSNGFFFNKLGVKKYFAPILTPNFESCSLLSCEIVFSDFLNFSIG